MQAFIRVNKTEFEKSEMKEKILYINFYVQQLFFVSGLISHHEVALYTQSQSSFTHQGGWNRNEYMTTKQSSKYGGDNYLTIQMGVTMTRF